MRFRNLDSDGDWCFGRGANDYVVDAEAVKLHVKTRLKSWVGDCFFDLPAGIDWKNRLGEMGQQAQLEQDLKLLILQTDGVARINEFESSVADRDFSAEYNIDTIYSTSFIDEFVEQE